MHTQLQLQENTTDPWMPCGYNVITEVKTNRFEDNFTSQFFAKLPDSEEYIAILERKLKKIKSNPNVLTQLAEKREACLEQLLMSETSLEQDQHTDFENSTSSIILKTIAPQKQALNPVELLELVKNDHLDPLQNKSNFSKKSLILITGASRGIGQTIAVEISKHLTQDSILILLARSENGLKDTKSQIQEIDKSLTVLTYTTDLSKPNFEEYTGIFKDVLDKIDQSDIHFGIIFHNAGHIGVLKQTTDLIDLNIWKDYYDLNMFSVVLLNSAFIRNLQSVIPQLMAVNITSLLGRSPLSNMGMYGSAKAARDLFFKVLAVEEPKIIILNYSPGPVDTAMFNSIVEDAQSEEIRKNFKSVKDTQVLTTVQTVNKMINVIEKGLFKNGDIVDYYDNIDLE